MPQEVYTWKRPVLVIWTTGMLYSWPPQALTGFKAKGRRIMCSADLVLLSIFKALKTVCAFFRARQRWRVERQKINYPSTINLHCSQRDYPSPAYHIVNSCRRTTLAATALITPTNMMTVRRNLRKLASTLLLTFLCRGWRFGMPIWSGTTCYIIGTDTMHGLRNPLEMSAYCRMITV